MPVMAASEFFPGFEAMDVAVDGATIHAVTGGKGPPLLLLHGWPQSHVCWHRVAPALAEHFTLFIADLPGYGDSKGPAPDTEHFEYSKRAMGRRMLQFMTKLGHSEFAVAGHDRGGRVGYRMALDHGEAIKKLVILDIVPTLEIAEATDYKRALSSWYWGFLAQPAPLPERLISAEPDFLLDHLMKSWHVDGVLDPRAMVEYHRVFKIYTAIQAYCEDYRAGMSVDLEFDRADRNAGKKIQCPMHVFWGQRGTHSNYVDMIAVWKRWAVDVNGQAVTCGHFMPEEAPQRVAELMIAALQ